MKISEYYLIENINILQFMLEKYKTKQKKLMICFIVKTMFVAVALTHVNSLFMHYPLQHNHSIYEGGGGLLFLSLVSGVFNV